MSLGWKKYLNSLMNTHVSYFCEVTNGYPSFFPSGHRSYWWDWKSLCKRGKNSYHLERCSWSLARYQAAALFPYLNVHMWWHWGLLNCLPWVTSQKSDPFSFLSIIFDFFCLQPWPCPSVFTVKFLSYYNFNFPSPWDFLLVFLGID